MNTCETIKSTNLKQTKNEYSYRDIWQITDIKTLTFDI